MITNILLFFFFFPFSAYNFPFDSVPVDWKNILSAPISHFFFLTRCYWSKKINRKIWFLISWYRFLVCSRNQFPSIVKLFLRSNISCFYLLFFFSILVSPLKLVPPFSNTRLSSHNLRATTANATFFRLVFCPFP